MASDEATVDRVRRLLAERADVVEKGIVGGGLGFMVAGNLCCGVSSRGLTVRVGPDAMDEALDRRHVRPLEFGGRRTKAFVVVEPDGSGDDGALTDWVERGLRFVDTLPPARWTGRRWRSAVRTNATSESRGDDAIATR